MVYSCMSDKARLYSLVACTAGYHLRAAKHLVDQIGGLGSINTFALRTLLRPDLGIAALTLS
jgi:hypothetical protein